MRRLGQSPTLAPSGLGRGIAPIQIALNGPMVGDRVAAVEGEELRWPVHAEQIVGLAREQVDVLFDPRGVMTFSLELPTARYKSPERLRFANDLQERLASLATRWISASMPFQPRSP